MAVSSSSSLSSFFLLTRFYSGILSALSFSTSPHLSSLHEWLGLGDVECWAVWEMSLKFVLNVTGLEPFSPSPYDDDRTTCFIFFCGGGGVEYRKMARVT